MFSRLTRLRTVAVVHTLVILATATSAIHHSWAIATTGIALLFATNAALGVILGRSQLADLRVVNEQSVEAAVAQAVTAVDRRIEVAVARFTARASATLSPQTEALRALETALATLSSAGSEALNGIAELSDRATRTERALAEVRSVLDRVQVTSLNQWSLHRLHADLLSDQQALGQLLQRYSPETPLPLVAGWAMNPTGLLALVDAIEQHRPELVVETGSGTSTLWIAKTLERVGAGRAVALEHDEVYADQTRAMLDRHGVGHLADVRLAPLTDVATQRGTFQWYDLAPESLGEIDLLLVDGPPARTGRNARYPALPVLGAQLTQRAIVLLDDAQRDDELRLLDWWVEEDPSLRRLGPVARAVEKLARP